MKREYQISPSQVTFRRRFDNRSLVAILSISFISLLGQMNTLKKRTSDAYRIFLKSADFLQHPLLLIFRLYWGWQFFLTGRGKLSNHESVVRFFTGLGIPMPEINAWFVGGLECFGGLLLMAGLGSRPLAFILSITMIVAYLSVPADRVKVANIFSDPEPFLSADPFFFLLTSLLVLAFGAGLFSLDALIKHFCKSKK